MPIRPKKELTFSKCLEMGLSKHINKISTVADKAGKEFSIEQQLDKMEGEWKSVKFEVLPYKQTGTFIVKASEEISQMLDDHLVATQLMSFSPFKKAFEERIAAWENKLKITQEVLDEWLACQRSWLVSCTQNEYNLLFEIHELFLFSILSLYFPQKISFDNCLLNRNVIKRWNVFGVKS
jgi:hypothetical protein